MGHELPYLISRNELDCIVGVSAHPRKLHRSTIRENFPLYDIARSLAQGLGSGNETITVSDTGTSSPIRMYVQRHRLDGSNEDVFLS